MTSRPIILPLSRSRRRFYFRFLVAIFALVVPLLLLYATGYRFEGIGVVKTGGMYVGASRAGAEIYINDVLVRETGTFRRAFFVQDLEPGTYTIRVVKDQYHSWEKTLPVYPHIVTEAQAFNMPESPVLTLIPPTLRTQTTGTATTTPIVNPLYEDVRESFATTTDDGTLDIVPPAALTEELARQLAELELATSTREFRGMQLYEDDERVHAMWTRSAGDIPYYFCTHGQVCMETIVIESLGETPRHFDFFPGSMDLVILTLENGIYVTEIDPRSAQNIQPLFLSDGADFRIVGGRIYVWSNDRLYELRTDAAGI